MRQMTMSRRAGSPAATRRGAVSVELAMILPTLVILLFGTLEVGLLVRSSLGINHVANEAARIAAVGAVPATIDAHMASSAPGMNSQEITRTYSRRSWDSATATWSGWSTLGSNGTGNDAVAGDQIRVSLQYPHQLILRGLLGPALGASEDNTVTLSATVVTLRE